MIPAHSGTVTLTNGDRSFVVPLVDVVVAYEARLSESVGVTAADLLGGTGASVPAETVKLEGSFTFTTSTMTVARTPPPIGALRAWARSTSQTPWRRRSIASWRWAWRKAHTLTAMVMAWGWSS